MGAVALAVGIGAAGVIGAGASIYAGNKQAKAAKEAAAAQERAAMAGIESQEDMTARAIESQERSFERVVELLTPYREAGYGSLKAQQALLGLSGPDAQKSAISSAIQPKFDLLTAAGENAIRQNAAATGGLRGGNIQLALARFRPELMNSLIEQQFGNLNQITASGQAAASGQAQAAQAAGSNVSSLYGNMGTNLAGLYGNIGAAQAGGAIGAAQGYSNAAMGAANALTGAFNQYAGLQTTLGLGRLAKVW